MAVARIFDHDQSWDAVTVHQLLHVFVLNKDAKYVLVHVTRFPATGEYQITLQTCTHVVLALRCICSVMH